MSAGQFSAGERATSVRRLAYENCEKHWRLPDGLNTLRISGDIASFWRCACAQTNRGPPEQGPPLSSPNLERPLCPAILGSEA
jgi:hypothetical protein